MSSHTDKLGSERTRGWATRTGVTGLFLGALLTISVHGQTPSAPPAPPAAQTGYFIKLKVKAGKNAEFEKAISEMMVGVRTKEPRNVYCDLFHIPDDLQTYVILERYKDVESSKAHGDSAYLKKLGETLKNDDLLDGPPDVEPLVYIRSK